MIPHINISRSFVTTAKALLYIEYSQKHAYVSCNNSSRYVFVLQTIEKLIYLNSWTVFNDAFKSNLRVVCMRVIIFRFWDYEEKVFSAIF